MTWVVGELELANVPAPLTTLQDPVVPTAFVADSVAKVPHPMAKLVPALTGSPMKTFVVDDEATHVESEMVHTNVLVPVDRPVTVVVGLAESANTPLPACTVHNPVPTVGVFAAMVTVRMQGKLWSGPATLVVTVVRVMVTSEVDALHVVPMEVQRKTLAPNPRPVTDEVGELGETMVPAPDTRVHVPVLTTNELVPVLNVPPVVSVLPAKVVVEAHPTLVLVPALAVVGQEPHPLGQGSHKSPTRSTSASSWLVLASVGQLSFGSQTVSPS